MGVLNKYLLNKLIGPLQQQFFELAYSWLLSVPLLWSLCFSRYLKPKWDFIPSEVYAFPLSLVIKPGVGVGQREVIQGSDV